MEELKIGEYGRTNLGNIFIFAWLAIDGKIFENKVILGDGQKITNDFYYFAKDEKIVKHSKNIIDIIEEGDYVNGYKVIDVLENLETGELHLEMPMDYTNQELGDCTIYNKDIKDVVTKEQFEQMKYIVGDESNEYDRNTI